MNLDPEAKYLESHEWARQEGDLIVTGVSDHAQESLSDVVFVELPQVGATLSKGDIFGVVESVKAASDLYMPMDGEIVEVNAILEDEPELVNSEPYGGGWMIKFRPTTPGQWDDLLSGADYEKVVEAEA
ncbi:MAG TPA: glycine cleavage system protein GcvH [Anaerolineae bacterium]|nr:glycine cleavage system protein GcvH [Anaerolineae bacterium]HMR68356.1 glycine cleavage system protein GcvH [Anaerolineae bacterium]